MKVLGEHSDICLMLYSFTLRVASMCSLYFIVLITKIKIILLSASLTCISSIQLLVLWGKNRQRTNQLAGKIMPH